MDPGIIIFLKTHPSECYDRACKQNASYSKVSARHLMRTCSVYLTGSRCVIHLVHVTSLGFFFHRVLQHVLHRHITLTLVTHLSLALPCAGLLLDLRLALLPLLPVTRLAASRALPVARPIALAVPIPISVAVSIPVPIFFAIPIFLAITITIALALSVLVARSVARATATTTSV